MPKRLETYRPPIMGTTHMVSAGHYLAAAADTGFSRKVATRSTRVSPLVSPSMWTLPSATNFGGVAPIAIYDAASDES